MEGEIGKFFVRFLKEKFVLDMSKMKNGQRKNEKSLLLLQNALKNFVYKNYLLLIFFHKIFWTWITK
jgi:hypothetical protein